MAADDLRTREQLVADGSLFQGYHPRMREVHERNAARLTAIIDEHGWPGRSLVGEEGARAAWLVLQHAIGNPALQRRGLDLLRQGNAQEVTPIEVAMLEDRIRSFEGRGQRYGTQFDWDEHGVLNPLPIEDEPNVDARRREVGLVPLAEEIRNKREQVAREGERPPRDWAAWQRERDQWLRFAGWRD